MNIRIYSLLSLLLVLLSGCYRDELCFLHPQGARIRLVAQYDPALVPDKSFVAIYNEADGTLVREEMMKTPFQHDLSLGLGRYHLVVYNEPILEGEYTTANSVAFGERTVWSDFRALAIDDPTLLPLPNSRNDRSVHAIEDQLATDRILSFEVTPGMITTHHVHPTPIDEANYVQPIDTTLRFFPRRVFTQVNVALKVTNYPGWSLRRHNGNRPQFFGAANHYLLGENRYATAPTSQYMEMLNGIFVEEGGGLASVFHTSFYMVGLQDDAVPTLQNGYSYTTFFRFEHGSSASPTGIEILPFTVNLVTGEGADWVSLIHTRAGEARPADGKSYYNDIFDIEIGLKLPERAPIGEDTDAELEDWIEEDVPLDTPPLLYFHPNGAQGQEFRWRYPVGTWLYMPAPTSFTTPAGYRFKEWNTSANGTSLSLPIGAPFRMPTGGARVYAIYERE